MRTHRSSPGVYRILEIEDNDFRQLQDIRVRRTDTHSILSGWTQESWRKSSFSIRKQVDTAIYRFARDLKKQALDTETSYIVYLQKELTEVNPYTHETVGGQHRVQLVANQPDGIHVFGTYKRDFQGFNALFMGYNRSTPLEYFHILFNDRGEIDSYNQSTHAQIDIREIRQFNAAVRKTFKKGAAELMSDYALEKHSSLSAVLEVDDSHDKRIAKQRQHVKRLDQLLGEVAREQRENPDGPSIKIYQHVQDIPEMMRDITLIRCVQAERQYIEAKDDHALKTIAYWLGANAVINYTQVIDEKRGRPKGVRGTPVLLRD
jgi:hypothetical protein